MATGKRDKAPNLYGMERGELEAFLEPFGAARYNAGQVYRWLYSRGVLDPSGWTDLSLSMRERISGACCVDPGRIASSDGDSDGTVKYRIELCDGKAVEAVFMEQDGRLTLCISSQVGCALGCDFCLTGTMGLQRNLSAGEIVGQVLRIRETDPGAAEPFNIVFMGMGEPLHNFKAVTAALRILADPRGFGISRKRITLSTAGLAPAIEKLAAEPVRPRLAISLNAVDDELRSRLMPINRRYPLETLLRACRAYAEATGDRITFEYVLLKGVNDRDRDISGLVGLLRRHRAKLNLIAFNPVPGLLRYDRPSRERIERVRDRLLEAGAAVSIRRSRGRNVRAACGQLALPDGAGK
jgi:23S rRNA (adenine2503-C2)-methyltransferase